MVLVALHRMGAGDDRLEAYCHILQRNEASRAGCGAVSLKRSVQNVVTVAVTHDDE
jgi:hypothetical protein